MGTCTSHQLTHQSLNVLPTPITLSKENVFLLYYPTEENRKINFDEVYLILHESPVFQIKKIHLVDQENRVTRDLVYVQGFHVQKPKEHLAMIIEVANSKVVVQIGIAELLNLIINSQRKFIVSQVKPPFVVCMNSILQRVFEVSCIASTKEIMKNIRLMNKS